MKKISILMLTHNAPKYVLETIKTLTDVTNTEDLEMCELIVWDNNSQKETKDILKELKKEGKIDVLYFSSENLLFAGGNNNAAKLASPETQYYLLLNSDIKIKNPNWIKNLFSEMRNSSFAGASYGFCSRPNRCDGYALLIEKKLYDKYQLDEEYQWWWSVTKLQSQILKEGKDLLAFKYHNWYIFHYGGKSGKDFKNAKGMNTSVKDIIKWFSIGDGKIVVKNKSLFHKIKNYIHREK